MPSRSIKDFFGGQKDSSSKRARKGGGIIIYPHNGTNNFKVDRLDLPEAQYGNPDPSFESNVDSSNKTSLHLSTTLTSLEDNNLVYIIYKLFGHNRTAKKTLHQVH